MTIVLTTPLSLILMYVTGSLDGNVNTKFPFNEVLASGSGWTSTGLCSPAAENLSDIFLDLLVNANSFRGGSSSAAIAVGGLRE